MKYNNFLIALALFVGFSSIQMNVSAVGEPEAKPTSGWGSWRPSMPSYRSIKERVTSGATSAYNSMAETMSSWGITKLRATLAAAISALLAAGYNREALIDMIRQIPQQPAYKMAQGALQSAAPYATAGNALKAVGGAAALGATGYGIYSMATGLKYPEDVNKLLNRYIFNHKNYDLIKSNLQTTQKWNDDKTKKLIAQAATNIGRTIDDYLAHMIAIVQRKKLSNIEGFNRTGKMVRIPNFTFSIIQYLEDTLVNRWYDNPDNNPQYPNIITNCIRKAESDNNTDLATTLKTIHQIITKDESPFAQK